MTKNELVIVLLQKLKPYRDMAEDFLLLLEQQKLETKFIDDILEAIYQAMKELQHDAGDEKFHKAVQLIKKIKDKESKESWSEEELNALLDDI